MRILIVASCLAAMPAWAQASKTSSFELMKPETQAMQRDDASNPAMLWTAEGRQLWSQKAGASDQSCADCHGDVASLRGVALRFPAFNPGQSKVVTLDQQIQICRTQAQKAEPWALETRPVLALSALVGLQSRGLDIAPTTSAEAATVAQGRALFIERRGQMNLSCAQCHDDNDGKSLGGAVIPQGHPTGYPLYRLEWQDLGSVERRLRNCMTGVRSEPYAYGSPEMVALEAYLRDRAAGLPLETPAVRP
jgi:sulfur-oxidizing protein SoxA